MKNITIAVAGASASGKTRFINAVLNCLNENFVSHLDMDGYHLHNREEREKLGEYPDELKANDFAKLSKDIVQLLEEKNILMPVYDHQQGKFAEPRLIKPKPVLFVEGLHAGLINQVSNISLLDYSIFLKPDEYIRRAWTVKLDVEDRQYTYQSAIQQIKDRSPFVKKHVLPQSDISDFLLFTTRKKKGGFDHCIIASDKFIKHEREKRPLEFETDFFFDFYKQENCYGIKPNSNIAKLVEKCAMANILDANFDPFNNSVFSSFRAIVNIFTLLIGYLFLIKPERSK